MSLKYHNDSSIIASELALVLHLALYITIDSVNARGDA